MKEIDLGKYKLAWKNEQSFTEEKLSRNQIQEFMQSASKNIGELFKKGLIIDIILKVLLTLSFCMLLVLYSNQNRIQLIDAVLILLTIVCIAFQIKVYKKIPDMKNAGQNIKSLLYSYIDFYNNKFVISLIITSLTSSLFFISGALYYFYFKYGKIRSFQLDDYAVFSIIIAIGFIFSAFVQRKNFNFHIHQLEKSLAEIEQDSINEYTLIQYKKRRFRNIIIIAIGLAIGIIILAFLVFL